MLILALDTSDARGSVALAKGEAVLRVTLHDAAEDYSRWLLPAVERTLASAGARLVDVELFAVSAGPGSFTGLRVGLTSVKAWSEVYGRPVVPVSRLEALAEQARVGGLYVASFVDARRDQVFAGLYRRCREGVALVGEEAVVTLAGFLDAVQREAGSEPVGWISLDPELLRREPGWAPRAARGESVEAADPSLASTIAQIAARRARAGQLKDALTLDANYVRRSDAELFLKGTADGR